MWQKVKIAGVAILALVVLIVVLQNTEAVEMHLLFVSFTIPQAAQLFGALVIGFIIGIFTAGRFFAPKKPKTPKE